MTNKPHYQDIIEWHYARYDESRNNMRTNDPQLMRLECYYGAQVRQAFIDRARDELAQLTENSEKSMNERIELLKLIAECEGDIKNSLDGVASMERIILERGGTLQPLEEVADWGRKGEHSKAGIKALETTILAEGDPVK